MCNDYRLRRAYSDIAADLDVAGVAISSPPLNIEPRDDIRITDVAPIVRRNENGRAEMVNMRWSWPGPGGKPVYNLRSEGRSFPRGRCLIPADGFYELTDPEPPAPKRARKAKWQFTDPDGDLLFIAGLWRSSPAGDAFSMLTTEPGPDVAPYHNRQIVVLQPDSWSAWLDLSRPESDDLRARPEASLAVRSA